MIDPNEVLPSPQVMSRTECVKLLLTGSGLANVAMCAGEGYTRDRAEVDAGERQRCRVDDQGGGSRAWAESRAHAARRFVVHGGDRVGVGIQRWKAEGGLAAGVKRRRGGKNSCTSIRATTTNVTAPTVNGAPPLSTLAV